jgi:putative molybdopterin biosynthesis protein
VDQSDAPDTFLTVAEVAGILKLNQQTVRNWIDQGSLPALRVGRRVRIRRSDFERILAEGYTGSSGESGGTGESGPAASGGSAPSGETPAPASAAQRSGPTAEDFWGGEALGVAAAINDPAAGNGNSA